jgi:hypothetical protein
MASLDDFRYLEALENGQNIQSHDKQGCGSSLPPIERPKAKDPQSIASDVKLNCLK